MADFPLLQNPTYHVDVSAPTYIDPMHIFQSDSGHEFRRSRHSRARRRYEVIYRGLPTDTMRDIRDFLHQHRMGVLPFGWFHPTSVDVVIVSNTTPVWLGYHHGLLTGQWVWITNATPHTALNGIRQVTRENSLNVSLPGTIAGGGGTATVQVYLPQAVARFPNDTWQGPEKLIGPEAVNNFAGTSTGFWNVPLVIEELL